MTLTLTAHRPLTKPRHTARRTGRCVNNRLRPIAKTLTRKPPLLTFHVGINLTKRQWYNIAAHTESEMHQIIARFADGQIDESIMELRSSEDDCEGEYDIDSLAIIDVQTTDEIETDEWP